MKYKKTDKGTLVSQAILCNTEVVYVHISLVTLTYFINLGSNFEDKTIKKGYANTLPSVKKKAKQALKDLGAKMFDEIRNRGSVEKFT